MIFISRGKGGWIFTGLFISLSIVVGLQRFLLPQANLKWLVCLALALTGAGSVALGVHARLSPERLMIERQTGRERKMRLVHSVYGIRAEYWGGLFLILACWLLTLHRA